VITDVLSAMSGMKENEITALTMKANGHGYKTIGHILGVTPERARQVTNRAVRKLVHPARMSVIHKQYPKITSDDVWGILKLRGKNK